MRVIKWFFTSLFICITIVVVVRQDIMVRLSESIDLLDKFILLAYFILFLAMRLLYSLSFRESLRSVNSHITLDNAFGLTNVKGFFNLGITGAGISAQAVQGKAQGVFTFGQLAYASIYQQIIFACILLALFSVTAIQIIIVPEYKLMVGALGLIGVSILILLPKKGEFLRKNRNWLPHWKWLIEVTEQIPDHIKLRRSILRVSAFQFFAYLTRLARLVLIAIALNPDIRALELSASVMTADLAAIVPLTAGGTGVRELVIAVGGSIFNDLETFLAAAIIDRLLGVAGSIFLGLTSIAIYQIKENMKIRHS